jgi:hypothetical protein
MEKIVPGGQGWCTLANCLVLLRKIKEFGVDSLSELVLSPELPFRAHLTEQDVAYLETFDKSLIVAESTQLPQFLHNENRFYTFLKILSGVQRPGQPGAPGQPGTAGQPGTPSPGGQQRPTPQYSPQVRQVAPPPPPRNFAPAPVRPLAPGAPVALMRAPPAAPGPVLRPGPPVAMSMPGPLPQPTPPSIAFIPPSVAPIVFHVANPPPPPSTPKRATKPRPKRRARTRGKDSDDYSD